jgi:hypothetical protein
VCVCVCFEDTVSYGTNINMFYFRSSAALTPCDYSNFIDTFTKQYVIINVLCGVALGGTCILRTETCWDCTVGVETRLRAEPSRVRIAAVKDVLFSKSSVPGLGHTQPPVQWVPGFFPVAVRVVDRSRLSSAEVKNE